MQSSVNSQFSQAVATSVEVGDATTTQHDTSQQNTSLYWFHSHFQGTMEMYADPDAVSRYLDLHQGWFRRCAAPMKVAPVGQNGYDLTIGKFGALGYHVEPKIGLELIPQCDRVYRIETIPIPDYTPPGYEVDFKAKQVLEPVPDADAAADGLPITRVAWELHLSVGVMFPKFILALSPNLIQKTGDRLITQIVKQVSRRLTRKVQDDFHNTLSPEATKRYRKLSKSRTSFSCDPRPTTDETPQS